MGWGSRKSELEEIVESFRAELKKERSDLDIARMQYDQAKDSAESAIDRARAAEKSLDKKIEESKRADRELENAIAGARRRMRGTGGRNW